LILLLDPKTVLPIKVAAIKTDVNPYLDKEYFDNRFKILDVKGSRKAVYIRHKYKCAACGEILGNTEKIELHHIIPRKMGGTDSLDNLVPLHKTCHEGVTYARTKWFKHIENV
jgi:RNA-directed DNA polymerase